MDGKYTKNRIKKYFERLFIIKACLMIAILFIALTVGLLFIGFSRYIFANIKYGEYGYPKFFAYSALASSVCALISSIIANVKLKEKSGNEGMWAYVVLVFSILFVGISLYILAITFLW